MFLAKNVRIVLSRSIVSQIIVIASIPIITELYSPEDMGFYGSILAMVSIIGMVSSCRLERRLFQLNGRDNFFPIFYFAIQWSLFVSLAISLFITVLASLLSPDYSSIYFIPIFFWGFSCSLVQVFTVYNSSKGLFELIGKATIMRSLGLIFLQISFWFILDPKNALISSAIFSQLLCIYFLSKNVDKVKFSKLSLFIKQVSKNAHDILHGFSQSLFIAVSNNIALLVIPYFFGLQAAGLFLITEKIVRLPVNLVSNNLMPVFANYYQDSENRSLKIIFKYTGLLVLAAIAVVIIALISIDYVVSQFLSEKWEEVSITLKTLIFLIIPSFMAIPFKAYNLHFLDPKHTTRIEFFSLVMKVSLFFVSYFFGYEVFGFMVAIILTYIMTCALNIYLTTLALSNETINE